MNCRRSTTATQSIFRPVIGCVAIAVPLMFTTRGFTEEAIPSEPIGEAAVDEYLIAPVAQPAPQEPQPEPSQGDFPNSFVPRTRRDPNAAFVEPTVDESTDAKQPKIPQLREWQRKQRQLLDQQKALEIENEVQRETIEAMQRKQQVQQGKMNPELALLESERAMLEQQIQMLHKQLAQMAARQQQASAAPLPNDAQFIAFKLQYVDAHQIAVTLQKILDDAGPRIAFDSRVNMLLTRGNEKQISEVEQLVKMLDQPSEASAKRRGADIQSLQLRIVWLVDGVDGQDSIALVGQPVLDALLELGFKSPSVVCQQVTTLTPDEMRGGGQVKFGVPVLIRGKLWQLQGKGLVTPRADNRFAIEFSLDIEQPNGPSGQLSGSIYTPLSHYTVLGTTTLVEQTDNDANQYLSAFVVYLDHAPEFPANKSEKAKAKAAATPVEENSFSK